MLLKWFVTEVCVTEVVCYQSGVLLKWFVTEVVSY